MHHVIFPVMDPNLDTSMAAAVVWTAHRATGSKGRRIGPLGVNATRHVEKSESRSGGVNRNDARPCVQADTKAQAAAQADPFELKRARKRLKEFQAPQITGNASPMGVRITASAMSSIGVGWSLTITTRAPTSRACGTAPAIG
jgi:hypothetical protein